MSVHVHFLLLVCDSSPFLFRQGGSDCLFSISLLQALFRMDGGMPF